MLLSLLFIAVLFIILFVVIGLIATTMFGMLIDAAIGLIPILIAILLVRVLLGKSKKKKSNKE